jgi:DNA-binding IclR family transcriptional regulator
MRMIGRKRGGLTHAEISHGLEIPKSTCTYILKRLEREGFVLRNKGTGRYRIGVDVLPLAYNALLEVGLVSVAKPVLRELAKSTGLVAILGVRAGNRVIAIDCLDGAAFAFNSAEGVARELRPRGEPDGVGAEYSLNSSAPGKVLLAYSRQSDLSNTGGAPGMPPDRAECQITELEQIRERGYAIRERRFALAPFSIAAPVLDAKGNIRAALCIQENVLRPGNRDVEGWIMLLKKASQEISRRLAMPFVAAIDGPYRSPPCLCSCPSQPSSRRKLSGC